MAKGKWLLIFSFVAASMPVSAQGFYFDIGLGAGWAWTEIEGQDVAKVFNDAGVSFDEAGVDFSLKAGYGPFGRIPIYIVGEIGGIGHRVYDRSDYLQFNSYIIGPGVIYYPIPLIQLAGSIGFSTTANQSSFGTMYDSKGGLAGNVSIALDLGKRSHGCLIGLQYFGAVNKLENSGAEQKQSGVNIFVKYTYRHKIKPSLENNNG